MFNSFAKSDTLVERKMNFFHSYCHYVLHIQYNSVWKQPHFCNTDVIPVHITINHPTTGV
jgi:hypothetical protein